MDIYSTCLHVYFLMIITLSHLCEFGINEFEISISACLGVHTMQQSTNTITSHFIIIYSFSNKRKIK